MKQYPEKVEVKMSDPEEKLKRSLTYAISKNYSDVLKQPIEDYFLIDKKPLQITEYKFWNNILLLANEGIAIFSILGYMSAILRVEQKSFSSEQDFSCSA